MKFISALLLLALGTTTVLGFGPEMVRPETLPQGFVLIVKDESGQANKDNPIYMASSINGWNPSDENMVLSGRSDTRWQIVIDKDLHGVGVQFKFALGSWDREEYNGSGEPIANRTLPLVDISNLEDGERPVIELTIPEFRYPVALSEEVREKGIYRKLNVTGTIKRIEVRGGAGDADSMTRDLLIWLPPGYEDEANASRHYPVMYMFDGQNLFDQLPGVAGEWRIDETMTSLIESNRIEPVIVVGIPHSGANRTAEYLPMGSIQGVEGDGAAFMQWMIREVMPKTERAFRIKKGSDSRAIGGASLGGMMALYASTTYPELFGMAIVESLPMISKEAVLEHLDDAKGWPSKVMIGMGTDEVGTDPSDDGRNKRYVQWAQEIHDLMGSKGHLSESNRLLVLGQDQVHNENAWADRFGQTMEFMFPAN